MSYVRIYRINATFQFLAKENPVRVLVKPSNRTLYLHVHMYIMELRVFIFIPLQ